MADLKRQLHVLNDAGPVPPPPPAPPLAAELSTPTLGSFGHCSRRSRMPTPGGCAQPSLLVPGSSAGAHGGAVECRSRAGVITELREHVLALHYDRQIIADLSSKKHTGKSGVCVCVWYVCCGVECVCVCCGMCVVVLNACVYVCAGLKRWGTKSNQQYRGMGHAWSPFVWATPHKLHHRATPPSTHMGK